MRGRKLREERTDSMEGARRDELGFSICDHRRIPEYGTNQYLRTERRRTGGGEEEARQRRGDAQGAEGGGEKWREVRGEGFLFDSDEIGSDRSGLQFDSSCSTGLTKLVETHLVRPNIISVRADFRALLEYELVQYLSSYCSARLFMDKSVRILPVIRLSTISSQTILIERLKFGIYLDIEGLF